MIHTRSKFEVAARLRSALAARRRRLRLLRVGRAGEPARLLHRRVLGRLQRAHHRGDGARRARRGVAALLPRVRRLQEPDLRLPARRRLPRDGAEHRGRALPERGARRAGGARARAARAARDGSARGGAAHVPDGAPDAVAVRAEPRRRRGRGLPARGRALPAVRAPRVARRRRGASRTRRSSRPRSRSSRTRIRSGRLLGPLLALGLALLRRRRARALRPLLTTWALYALALARCSSTTGATPSALTEALQLSDLHHAARAATREDAWEFVKHFAGEPQPVADARHGRRRTSTRSRACPARRSYSSRRSRSHCVGAWLALEAGAARRVVALPPLRPRRVGRARVAHERLLPHAASRGAAGLPRRARAPALAWLIERGRAGARRSSCSSC